MILDPDPAALIGRAAAVRVAELQQTLQRFRREHEAALGALPPISEDPVAHALAAPSRRLLAQVETALERLADGTYGRCVSCQRHIPQAPGSRALPRTMHRVCRGPRISGPKVVNGHGSQHGGRRTPPQDCGLRRSVARN